MSSYLFSIMAQSNIGSDWNWFVIFIVFVVILAIALIVQAQFSKKDAAELEHLVEAHHDEAKLEPVVESAPEPEAVVETPAEPDNLKKIEGIGLKVANLLNENGITSFAQLAETSIDKLNEILDANKLQMMDPASWPQQAKLAAAGDWDALQKMQDELKGGR